MSGDAISSICNSGGNGDIPYARRVQLPQQLLPSGAAADN